MDVLWPVDTNGLQVKPGSHVIFVWCHFFQCICVLGFVLGTCEEVRCKVLGETLDSQMAGAKAHGGLLLGAGHCQPRG